jgi:hypothetical protein
MEMVTSCSEVDQISKSPRDLACAWAKMQEHAPQSNEKRLKSWGNSIWKCKIQDLGIPIGKPLVSRPSQP